MTQLNHLVSAAGVLAPKLLRRVQFAETHERLPASTIGWFREHQISRILDWNPLATVEERLFVLGDVVRILGSTCLSTGWTAALYALHFWLIRRFGPAAWHVVSSETESPLLAAAFQPRGSALRCDEGYIVTGEWEWVSGICDADYILLNAVIENTGVRCFFLLRSRDIKIIRGTDLGGLRGTGSHVVHADRVLVPEHLSLEEEVLRGSNAPGDTVQADPLLRCPLQPVLAVIGSSIAVGAAEEIVALLARSFAKRKDRTTAEFGTRVQMRIGEVAVYANEARVMWEQTMRDLATYAASDSTDRSVRPIQFRMASSEIVHHAWNAASGALELLGTKRSLSWQVVERAHRDLRALRSHYVYRRDESAEAVGRTLVEGKFGYTSGHLLAGRR